MIQETSKATTTRHDKSSLNHEAKLTTLKSRSRWLIYLIRPSETPTYRPSPAGSKATLRTSVSSEVNHFHGQENVKRTGDFRQCEDAITAYENCDDRYDHCCETQR
ncbi:unnamed protein product [Brassica rapa subsp. trilocularis]